MSIYKLETKPDGSTVAVPTPEEEWEESERRKRREDKLRRAEVPPRLWPVAMAPKETDALEAVRRFMHPDNPRTFLILAGGVGTGKTVAASWAVLKVPQQTKHDPVYGDSVVAGTARFIKALDLTRAGTYAEGFWEELRDADLLILDDVGTEPRDEKGWAAANFEALMDYRYDYERKTILTTNMPPDEFKARYCSGTGVRLLDRLREAGTLMSIGGDSMRTPPEGR